MKKLILFCISALLLCAACNNDKTQRAKESTESRVAEVTPLPSHFYKRLEGQIAGKNVVMHLERIDSAYSGVYYYDGTWLSVRLDSSMGKDSLNLTEYSMADYSGESKSAHLILKWTGKGFNGRWVNGKKDKQYEAKLIEKYPEGSFSFSYHSYSDSSKAFPDRAKSPAAHLSLTYLESADPSAIGQYINNQLKMSLNYPVNGDWQNTFQTKAAKYFKDYRKDIKENGMDNGRDTVTFWMNYTSSSTQNVMYNDRSFLIIELLNDDYTGGAHGYYSSTFFCYDVAQKKKMALADVVKIDSGTLQKLLENNLRKQYHIKSGAALNTFLFDNFLKANKNFYFNKNGLAFLYNPYEVASYAQGQVSVFIPYAELRPYLNPGFKRRMGL